MDQQSSSKRVLASGIRPTTISVKGQYFLCGGVKEGVVIRRGQKSIRMIKNNSSCWVRENCIREKIILSLVRSYVFELLAASQIRVIDLYIIDMILFKSCFSLSIGLTYFYRDSKSMIVKNV